MTIHNKKLHFRHYTYIFMIVAFSTFSFTGWLIYNKVNNISREFKRNASLEASLEIKQAIEKNIIEIKKIAAQISQWDEVHQQLTNPAYYNYWKAHRQSARELPFYVENIDLYNTSHDILGRTNDPETVQKISNAGEYYTVSDNYIDFILIIPVLSRSDPHSSIGYLLIRSNILQSLTKTGQLAVTDPASIKVNHKEERIITHDEVIDNLQFSAIQNPLFDELLITTKSTLKYGFFLLLVFISTIYYIAHYLVNKPLSKLTKYVEQLQLGNDTEASELSFKIYEFNHLKDNIEKYQRDLTLIHTNLDKKNDELWNQAHQDSLTGAANRRAYEEDWKSYLAIADHKRLDFSYMLIDCDHFKAINDTYGHDTGDKLIIELAGILHKSLRDGDKLYRIGGDEFVTILWDSEIDQSDKTAQRCLANIRNHSFESLGINEPVNVSIGIATHTKDSHDSMSALPRQADLAMYNAKKSGSRSIIHYSPSMETDLAPLISNRIIDAVMKAAGTGEGIAIHYQPIVNTKTLKINYYEALLRIKDNQGLICAGDIFPVAEKFSLEAEIDLAILLAIEHDLKNKLLPAKTGVSINLSTAIFSMPDFTKHVLPLVQYLKHYKIIFEVTEKTLITDLNMVSIKLIELQKQGFQIALDDFGSGYSSIRYLANMPIDIVKFDISMTKQLLSEDKSRSIISGTAGVILKSGFKLVAEGIENMELLELVTKMGATHMQGYVLGRPQTIDAILRP